MKGPILIGGDGRSGTTLLQGILDSHPELSVGPELHFTGPPNLTTYVLDCLNLAESGDRRLTEAGIREHPQYRSGLRFLNRLARFGIDKSEVRDVLSEAVRDQLLGEEFHERLVIVERLSRLRATKSSAIMHGFKIMKLVRQSTQFLKHWPQAKILHIVRDGRDVAASQILDHPSWGYQDVNSAAAGWATMAQAARIGQENGTQFALRYEDLVASPQTVLAPLLEFLGVSHREDLATMDRSHLSRTLGHHPSATRIAGPIDISSVGRWRRELSEEEAEMFLLLAADELRFWRYVQ